MLLLEGFKNNICKNRAKVSSVEACIEIVHVIQYFFTNESFRNLGVASVRGENQTSW